MNRTLLAGLLVLFCCGTLLAQPFPDTLWRRTYPGNIGFAGGLVNTTNHGYVIATGDRHLTKLDSDGEIVWQRLVPVRASALITSIDGNYALAGHDNLFGFSCDNCLAAASADGQGELLWTKAIDFDIDNNFSSIQQTSDGGFILAGYVNTTYGFLPYRAIVVKLSTTGDSLWSHTYDQPILYGLSIVQTGSSGYLLATESYINLSYHIILTRLAENGDSLSATIYNGLISHTSLRQINENLFAMACQDSNSMILFRFDVMGNQLSIQHFPIDPGTSVFDLQLTRDGGFIIGASTLMVDTQPALLLIKTDSMGAIAWRHTYPMDVGDDFHGTAIGVTEDNGYAIAGIGIERSLGDSLLVLTRIAPDPSVAAANQPVQLNPSAFSLSSYPNPFNPSSTISFTLPHVDDMKLMVYDIAGREVQSLTEGVLSAGEHQVTFDASALPSGIYFARLEGAGMVKTQKLLLVK